MGRPDEPAFTIKATPKEPIRMMIDGVVKRLTGRALARLQGVPALTPATPERGAGKDDHRQRRSAPTDEGRRRPAAGVYGYNYCRTMFLWVARFG